ncbi:MAG: hypothetical protein PHY92_09895 [Alphaproteobacteria bacterium]|nr:hypothetical protein [Alphaproteobacteria bacterium]
MKLKKLGAITMGLIFGFAAVAADLTMPKTGQTAVTTFDFKAEPFTETGISDTVLPGLGDRITGEITVDVPAGGFGEITSLNQIKSFSFSCGSVTQNNINSKLGYFQLTFSNGMPSSAYLCTDNYYFNPPPSIQFLVVTGDIASTLPDNTAGGLSWLAATVGSPWGTWQINKSDVPGTWTKRPLRSKDPAGPARMLLLGD